MRRVACLALVVLLAAAPAAATSGDYVDVVCPVCENKFEGWEWKSTNSFGGVDMDGCKHAAGGQVFLRICWTCPACLYTGLQSEWQKEDERPAEVIARLKTENPLKALEPVDPKTGRTTDIPAGVRWDLYLQVLALRKAKAEEMISALLHAAWTQRFGSLWPDDLEDALRPILMVYIGAASPPKGVRRNRCLTDIEASRRMEQDACDATLRLSDLERQHRLLLAAAWYKHRGEDPDATRVLDTMRKRFTELGPPISEGISLIEARIAWERRYIERAVPLLVRLLESEDLPEEHRPWVHLRLGELQRKLDLVEDALSSFEQALRAELPDKAREMVQERVEKTKAMKISGGSDEKGEETRKDRGDK